MTCRSFARAISFAGLLALTACEPPASSMLPAADRGPIDRTVYVISNGWHTGIVIARADLSPGRVPEAEDFPEARYIEFGWGDRDYYPSRDPSVGMALSAALAPGPSVMHLAGHGAPPQDVYPKLDVLALGLDAQAVNRLTDAIDASFARPKDGRAESAAPGLYRDSLFYPGRGEFHLFNTCNTWTARVLAAAGVAVSPDIVRADGLMDELRGAANVRALRGTGAPAP